MGALPTRSLLLPLGSRLPARIRVIVSQRQLRADSASAAALVFFFSSLPFAPTAFNLGYIYCASFSCVQQLSLCWPGQASPLLFARRICRHWGHNSLHGPTVLLRFQTGHTSNQLAHDLLWTNRKALVFPPSAFRSWCRDTQIPTPTCLSVASAALALVSSHIHLLG